jgi:hypothetical protein
MSPSSSRSQREDGHSLVKANDERTPLLAAVASALFPEAGEAEVSAIEAHQVEHSENGDEAKQLDFTQIFLLCYTRVIEPIAFFSIFPYINQMIENTGGIAKEDVGFYSGLIESLFSATQMCVMIFWGRVSDQPQQIGGGREITDTGRLPIDLEESRFLPFRYMESLYALLSLVSASHYGR